MTRRERRYEKAFIRTGAGGPRRGGPHTAHHGTDGGTGRRAAVSGAGADAQPVHGISQRGGRGDIYSQRLLLSAIPHRRHGGVRRGTGGCDGGTESQRLRLRDKDGSDHAAAAHRRGRGQPVVDGAERRVPAVLLGGDGGGDGAGIAAAHPEHRTGQRIIHAWAADAAAGGVCQQLPAPFDARTGHAGVGGGRTAAGAVRRGGGAVLPGSAPGEIQHRAYCGAGTDHRRLLPADGRWH